MLAQSALTIAALSLPRRLSAQDAPKNRRVVITIDDGPASGAGGDLKAFVRIATALREAFVVEKVPAIMFVNENQLHVDGQRDARVAVLQQWLEAGLHLGNHTYSHPNLNEVPLVRFLDDIVKGEVVSRPLLEARKETLRWFRYPFLATGTGDTAKVVEEFLAARGYRVAPVSLDYADYRFAGFHSRHLQAGDKAKADQQYATMLEALNVSFARAEAHSMEVLGYELPQTLLIHCNELNSLTMRTTLQRIRGRGYSFVSMDDAMNDPAYDPRRLSPGRMGAGGYLQALANAKHDVKALP
jgi:peptidoglycan/xylan/chitin deacetylase (PgdA/CDA1 family)